MFVPDFFLPCDPNGADMTAAIEEKLNLYGCCQLGKGVYSVSGIRMPEGATLAGIGGATKLLLRPDLPAGHTVVLDSFCTVRDLSVIGSPEPIDLPEAVGQRHGICFLGDATPKDYSNEAQHAMISGCFIYGFTGGGITCTDTGYSSRSSMNVTDCQIWNCGAGINITHFSEYHRFTGVSCDRCLYGCINNGGNNVFTNCGFNSNEIGFLIDNSRGQSNNNSHGSMVGCTINHSGGNGGIGIQVLGAGNGYSFTGCQLFFSHIILENSDDILFAGLNTGRKVEIHIKGGKLTVFTGCTFGHAPDAITVEDNALVKFIDCWTRDGEPVHGPT